MSHFNDWDTTNDRKASPPKVRRENCLHCSEPIRYDSDRGAVLSSVILEGGAKQPGLSHKDCHEVYR